MKTAQSTQPRLVPQQWLVVAKLLGGEALRGLLSATAVIVGVALAMYLLGRSLGWNYHGCSWGRAIPGCHCQWAKRGGCGGRRVGADRSWHCRHRDGHRLDGDAYPHPHQCRYHPYGHSGGHCSDTRLASWSTRSSWLPWSRLSSGLPSLSSSWEVTAPIRPR